MQANLPTGSRTAVPEGTQAGLTSGFGMGPGVSPPLWPSHPSPSGIRRGALRIVDLAHGKAVATRRKRGAKITATFPTSLIRMLRDGPAVSLNGSPTVSPMTAALWASPPFPP